LRAGRRQAFRVKGAMPFGGRRRRAFGAGRQTFGGAGEHLGARAPRSRGGQPRAGVESGWGPEPSGGGGPIPSGQRRHCALGWRGAGSWRANQAFRWGAEPFVAGRRVPSLGGGRGVELLGAGPPGTEHHGAIYLRKKRSRSRLLVVVTESYSSG
jgi:hypothetical protein